MGEREHHHVRMPEEDLRTKETKERNIMRYAGITNNFGHAETLEGAIVVRCCVAAEPNNQMENSGFHSYSLSLSLS